MPKGTRAIRRQIRSIGNTKKMTKAMEMVSASKMRRAVAAALATRPYATAAWDILNRLDVRHDAKLHPLLAQRSVRHLGIIVISTNRGLCGGFNNALLQKIASYITTEKARGVETITFYTFGKQGRDLAVRMGYSVAADFPKNDITRAITDITPISHVVCDIFARGDIDKVILMNTHFLSSVRQRPVAKTLLPFDAIADSDVLSEYVAALGKIDSAPMCEACLFEPSDEEVIRASIPRLLDIQIFQAVLESEASEHSARMLAMHNATESASDLLSDLNLTYNQVRQAGITQEIAEISSGRAALE